jgi:hypothetical protein
MTLSSTPCWQQVFNQHTILYIAPCYPQVFKAAKGLGGAIIFLDELDALATSRDREMHEVSPHSSQGVTCGERTHTVPVCLYAQPISRGARCCPVPCATFHRCILSPASAVLLV